jgi:acetamidase/formamidase
VLQPGAQLYVGDTHGAQGQGEVDQTAVEHPMALTARFTVRKNLRLTKPRVETPDRHPATGAHADLDVALRTAVTEAIALLREKTGGALSAADACALCSISITVDLVVAEAVDGNQLVTATVPEALLAG